MLINYHNHTDWSDGRATLEEMIAGARAAGLAEFGLSDHYAPFPDGRAVEWALAADFLPEYVERILAAKTAEASGLVIRLGIEIDFFPETIEAAKTELARYPFDYLIGSVHFVKPGPHFFPIDYDASRWEVLSAEKVNTVWRLYWVQIRALAESGCCDFIGHLDLPKKYGFLPTADFTAEANAALDAIAAAGLAIEINTAGWQKPVNEAYPSLSLLRAARERDIPLLINADAHIPADAAADYDRARALARQAGYAELVRFERRQRFMYPL
ncbi:MAG: histidinol-phosphatase [Armatimonadota bacterium]